MGDCTGSVWHMVTRNIAQDVREDNVFRYQVVDALDSPQRSVLLLVWTIAPGTLQIPGCKGKNIPTPLPGFVRSNFECVVYRFSPLWKSSSDKYLGFRLARSGVSSPSASIYCVIEKMSTQALKQSAKLRNERFYDVFKHHLSGSQLADR